MNRRCHSILRANPSQRRAHTPRASELCPRGRHSQQDRCVGLRGGDCKISATASGERHLKGVFTVRFCFERSDIGQPTRSAAEREAGQQPRTFFADKPWLLWLFPDLDREGPRMLLCLDF